MEDRLAEYRQVEKTKGSSPIPMQYANSNLMPEFSTKLRVLQQSINQIKTNNKEIISLKEKTIAAVTNELEKQYSVQVNHFSEQNKQLCSKVKTELESLQSDLETQRRLYPHEPETRIQANCYQAFSNKFTELLKEFQNVQMDYKNAMKNKIARQAKMLDSNLSDEQIQNIVDDPEGAQRLFSQQLLGQTHVKVQAALSDMQDKYNDIKKLEQGVLAIHEMFTSLAVIVQSQGATIDSIEMNLGQAQNYIKSANKKLRTAKKDHASGNKWRLLVLVALIIIAGVVAYFCFSR